MIFKNKLNLQLFAKKKVESEQDEEFEDDEIEDDEIEEKPKKKKTSNKNNEITELKNIMGEVLECIKGKPEINQKNKEIPIPPTPTPAQQPTPSEEIVEEIKENPIVTFIKKLW